MKNANNSLGNDYSTRELGSVAVPRPARGAIVSRKSVVRVDGRKSDVLLVDFARINVNVLAGYTEGN